MALMFGLGPMELVVILAVALLVFGPRKLPELARNLGRGLNEFRRAQTQLRGSIMQPDAPMPNTATAQQPPPLQPDAPKAAPPPPKAPDESAPAAPANSAKA